VELDMLATDATDGWVRRSVLVDLDPSIALDALEVELSAVERALAWSMPERRRRTYVGGRVALRRALAELGLLDVGDIGADDRGAPALPNELSGSIAHKDEVAVAYVERRSQGGRVGVDVELSRELSEGVVRRVLCDDELQELEACGEQVRARVALERFAAKEAIYKAIDPFLRRYVGFREVRLRETEPGLLHAEGAALEPLRVVAQVARMLGPRGQGLVLAFARARAR
jgi:enterobactin synthetase component D